MRSTSYLITYRCSDDPLRRANLQSVLRWALAQPVCEIIVVEQDVAPTLADMPPDERLRIEFAYNPGPFNKAWGWNVAARRARGNCLAFGDADTVCGSLETAVAACRAGMPVVRAFRGLIDLDDERSQELRDDPSALRDPSLAHDLPPDRTGAGERLPVCCGVVVFQSPVFALVGGWDERFLGWGGEDDAMDIKLQRAGITPQVLDRRDGFHLHHRRANGGIEADPHYRMNLLLLEQLRSLPETELKRLCDVGWQLAGFRDVFRPMAALPQ